MNRAIATQVLPVERAKHLRISESGVFAVVHGAQSGSAIHETKVAESAAVRLRSPERTAVRAEVATIVDTHLELHHVSNPDFGVVVNEAKEAVRRIRLGKAPLTADHLLRVARRNKGAYLRLFEDIVDSLRGRRLDVVAYLRAMPEGERRVALGEIQEVFGMRSLASKP